MPRTFLTSTIDLIESRRPILLYSAVWTVVLTMVVAVAAISPELAFLWSISPPSSSSSPQQQHPQSSSSFKWGPWVRVPLDIPSEAVSLPAELFRRSKIDYLVPPLFAAAVVAGSACVIRAFGW